MPRGLFAASDGRRSRGVRLLGHGAAPRHQGDRSGDCQLADWTLGHHLKAKLTGNVTAGAFAPPRECAAGLVLYLEQDSTGSRTVTWDSRVIWDSLSTPVLSTAAGAVDMVVFVWDGTNFRGSFWRGT